METDTLQSKRKTEDNDGGENKKSKQEAVNVKQNFGRWIINQDLKLCLEKSVPIVAYSAKMDYRFDPPNEGYGNNPYTLTTESQMATVLLAKCNGYIFGRFINMPMPKPIGDAPRRPTKPEAVNKQTATFANKLQVYMNKLNKLKKYKERTLPTYEMRLEQSSYKHGYQEEGSDNNHAEDAFLHAWSTAAENTDVIEKLRKENDGKLFVTLKLSRSPCKVCTEKLIKFVENTPDLKLRIKIQTLYEGDNGKATAGAANVHMLIDKGIPVRMWSVPFYAGKPRADGKTKRGQLHELSAWGSDGDDEQHKQLLLKGAKAKEARFQKYFQGDSAELNANYKKQSRNAK